LPPPESTRGRRLNYIVKFAVVPKTTPL
jgi:hypothetical protein